MNVAFILAVILFTFHNCQNAPNLILNNDNLAPGDGPMGYAFSPRAIAMDLNGNVYFTEANSIRMINSSGYVLTVSGPSTIPPAFYSGVVGIAVDSTGNLIVADSGNNQIKKIDPNGKVSVIGISGSVLFGIASNTSMVTSYATGLSGPVAIAFDSVSNLYVDEYNGNQVHKIINGTVSVLASFTTSYGMAVDSARNCYTGATKVTPSGSISTFSSSSFIPGAVDGSGNIYGANGNTIVKLSPAGASTTIAGSGTASSLDGQGTSATFNGPLGVTIDSYGNLIVADSGGCKIRKIYVNGTVTTIAGDGTCASIDGQGLSSSFNSPHGVAVDSRGNIYVSEYTSCKIRMINSVNYVSTFTGFNGCGYVNGTVSVAQFSNPFGLAIDNNTGNLFIADQSNNAIRQITFVKQNNWVALPLNSPTGVALDSLGNIFLVDQLNHIIRVINSTGTINFLAGSGTASFADGNGTLASFNSPFGIALDLYGNLIVADTGNNMIRNVSRSGIVKTIAGNGTAGWVDGQGTNSTLNSPIGVSVDGSNRVFITDSANNCVRVLNTTGFLNTLYFGRGYNIVLNAPQGILVAPNGDLLIADTGNKRIRRVASSMLIGRV